MAVTGNTYPKFLQGFASQTRHIKPQRPQHAWRIDSQKTKRIAGCNNIIIDNRRCIVLMAAVGQYSYLPPHTFYGSIIFITVKCLRNSIGIYLINDMPPSTFSSRTVGSLQPYVSSYFTRLGKWHGHKATCYTDRTSTIIKRTYICRGKRCYKRIFSSELRKFQRKTR